MVLVQGAKCLCFIDPEKISFRFDKALLGRVFFPLSGDADFQKFFCSLDGFFREFDGLGNFLSGLTPTLSVTEIFLNEWAEFLGRIGSFSSYHRNTINYLNILSLDLLISSFSGDFRGGIGVKISFADTPPDSSGGLALLLPQKKFIPCSFEGGNSVRRILSGGEE